MSLKRLIAIVLLPAALMLMAACADKVDASSEPKEEASSTTTEPIEGPDELVLIFNATGDATDECRVLGSITIPELTTNFEITDFEASARPGINEPTTYKGEGEGTEYEVIVTLSDGMSVNLWIRAHMGAWVVQVNTYSLLSGTQTLYETDLADDASAWNVAVDGTSVSIPSAGLYNMSAESGSPMLQVKDLEFDCTQ